MWRRADGPITATSKAPLAHDTIFFTIPTHYTCVLYSCPLLRTAHYTIIAESREEAHDVHSTSVNNFNVYTRNSHEQLLLLRKLLYRYIYDYFGQSLLLFFSLVYWLELLEKGEISAIARNSLFFIKSKKKNKKYVFFLSTSTNIWIRHFLLQRVKPRRRQLFANKIFVDSSELLRAPSVTSALPRNPINFN